MRSAPRFLHAATVGARFPTILICLVTCVQERYPISTIPKPIGERTWSSPILPLASRAEWVRIYSVNSSPSARRPGTESVPIGQFSSKSSRTSSSEVASLRPIFAFYYWRPRFGVLLGVSHFGQTDVSLLLTLCPPAGFSLSII